MPDDVLDLLQLTDQSSFAPTRRTKNSKTVRRRRRHIRRRNRYVVASAARRRILTDQPADCSRLTHDNTFNEESYVRRPMLPIV
jgi:hypothetical protein